MILQQHHHGIVFENLENLPKVIVTNGWWRGSTVNDCPLEGEKPHVAKF